MTAHSRTLSLILKHWLVPKPNGADMSAVTLPFHIENFCRENDAILDEARRALPAEPTKSDLERVQKVLDRVNAFWRSEGLPKDRPEAECKAYELQEWIAALGEVRREAREPVYLGTEETCAQVEKRLRPTIEGYQARIEELEAALREISMYGEKEPNTQAKLAMEALKGREGA